MELKPIKLKDKQDLRNINIEPADNSGCVVRYTIYTPALRNSESTWDEHVEVFSGDEVEDKAMARIVELYKADLAAKIASKGNSGGTALKG